MNRDGQGVLRWMVVGALVAFAAAGCTKTPEVGLTPPSGPETVTGPSTPPPGGGRAGGAETRVTPLPVPRESTLPPPGSAGATTAATGGGGNGPLQDVFFDYDAATLTDEARRALAEDAAWLKGNAQARITVEGHCDERGTSEYNLALGERRAKAVRDYLVAAGIDAGRIRTISYGKERPFAPGHDEASWKQNRRAHFTFDR